MRWRLIRFAAVAFALSASAAAAPSSDKEQARALAEQAGDALDARDFKQAIDLVTRAEALYHAPTHLLIAAEAHEGSGELVEAAELYERIVAEPLPAGSPAGFRTAQNEAVERIRALIARIPSVLVRVTPASVRASVTLDGRPLEVGGDAAKRVNPGSHTIRATAPGYRPYEKTLALQRGGVVTIEIALEREPEAPAGKPTAAAIQPKPARPETRSGSRVPAYVAFGFGAVGLGVGAVTGKMSLDRVAELDEACPDKHCPSGRKSDIDDAKLLGTISTIGFGVGLAGVAAGVVLWISSGPTHEKADQPAARTIEPWMSGSSLGVRGSF